MAAHYWIRARLRGERERLRDALDLPPVLSVLDAHRRLRGPYTAAGALIRQIADDLLGRLPELGARHNIEILTSTPELAGRVPSAWETLEWTVRSKERTRFYSRLHTLNIANGLAELIRDYLRELGGGPRTLVFENVHEADASDQEFVAVLLRRHDLGGLVVVAGTGTEPLVDPGGEIAISMAGNLHEYAERIDGPDAAPPAGTIAEADVPALARAFVDSDGTSDDPRLRAGYARCPAEQRAAMHDERAAVLAATGQPSLTLGAIPYHAEHGSDPAGAGAAAIKKAMDRCRDIGLYQAAAELGARGRALTDPSAQHEQWWDFTNVTSVVLASLGRADEAKVLHDEARAASIDPAAHMYLAYSTAMLYARHFPEPQRDYQQARAWMNMAIAIAGLLEDPKERAFHSVFGRNGLALVEVRQNQAAEALRLLEEGMARLDRELEPDEHPLHRVVLRYNRAQVFGMTGRLEEALADYRAVIKTDPEFPEHHFNVGNILRRLGRNDEAIASYELALRLSPPFPEVYYNLGDTRLELGDVDGALAAFGYTIELDPGNVDARVNRAGIRCDRGELDGAWEDATAGLALEPDNAHLLSVKGRVLAERGDVDAARDALSAALERNPKLAEAWAILGELDFGAGDLDTAIADLDRAVELAGSPEIRYNRAVVYQAAGRYRQALADYDAVLGMLDDDDVLARREACLLATEAAGV